MQPRSSSFSSSVPPPLPSSAVLLAALDVVGAAVMPSADAELRRVAAFMQLAQAGSEDAVDALSPFHSSAVPHLSLAAYARHVANATGYGAEGLAVGLALMARYDRAAAARAADAAVDATLVGVTALTMHRLFATCMQLGMKTASDHFVKNAYVARLVGMTLAELNALELELAVALDFRCLPTCAEMCELPRALADITNLGSDCHVLTQLHALFLRHTEDEAGEPALPGFAEVPADDPRGSPALASFAAAASLTAAYAAEI